MPHAKYPAFVALNWEAVAYMQRGYTGAKFNMQ